MTKYCVQTANFYTFFTCYQALDSADYAVINIDLQWHFFEKPFFYEIS